MFASTATPRDLVPDSLAPSPHPQRGRAADHFEDDDTLLRTEILVPPAFEGALPAATAAIAALQPLRASTNPFAGGVARVFEVEARLGACRDGGGGGTGRFRPTISKEDAARVVYFAEASPGWRLDKDWQEYKDVYFRAHLRSGAGTREEEVRGRVTYDVDRECVETTYTVKRRVSVAEVRGDAAASIPDARIAVATEDVVAATALLDADGACLKIVEPNHVRLKQTKEWVFQSPTHPQLRWRLICAIVWSGATRAAAEEQQHLHAEAYEVELECEAPERVLGAFEPDYIALSALQKLVQPFRFDASGTCIVADDAFALSAAL